jgi:hypothetical protein
LHLPFDSSEHEELHVFFLYAQPAVFLQVLLASPEHASPPPDEEQVSPFSRSQQPFVPHGATRSLPDLAEQYSTSQRASGNVPSILLSSRYLRRRGAVARRAGRRGRGGNSQLLQRRELAELGRDRAVDLVAVEVPATPLGGRAPRRASGTRGELAGPPAP